MDTTMKNSLQQKLDEKNMAKLEALNNEALNTFLLDAITLCEPESVFIMSDSQEDVEYIRQQAIHRGEEITLNIQGHTLHWDGYNDQARDKANTRYLLRPEVDFGNHFNRIDKTEGLTEVKGYLAGSMKGKQLLLCPFCLGPTNSPFSISCIQATDSFYVAHSLTILYRAGYEQFKKLNGSNNFFRILHSAGELTEQNTSKNVDKRRVYIDLEDEYVYSVNTQYAGNTVGLKKLSLRLAIHRAQNSDWLTEHMFLMGINGPNNRKTYFAGAYPSACGKTSTAMLPRQSIVGDDIIYMKNINGEATAVNIEQGVFGIITDVNVHDDPEIWKVLHTPGEVIFSNILENNGNPYWLNMGEDIPTSGRNFSGEWTQGKKDENGKEISHAHKNARYTIRISELENRDKKANAPDGCTVAGIIYGGRDSDTCVPVEEAYDWVHGTVTKGASIESETTAATLGAEGVRKFNLFANLDFISVPFGQYITNHFKFAAALKNTPKIFSTNYFLKKDGVFLNDKLDKLVWIKWMELRIHNEVDAIKTPTGYIPKYEDLVPLFRDNRDKEYTKEEYINQFTIRIPKLLEKIDRIEAVYKKEKDIPEELFSQLNAQRMRLKELQAAQGDYVSPCDL